MSANFVIAHSPKLPKAIAVQLPYPHLLTDSSPLYFWQMDNSGKSESFHPITSSPSGSFFDSFFDQWAHSQLHPNRPDTLVFVHGFQTSFARLRLILNQLIRCYVQPANSSIGRVVLFHWPSANILSYKAYRSERLDAIDSAWVFADLIFRWADFMKNVATEPPTGNIHLMCHSMGNFLLQHTMEYLTANISRVNRFFSQIILAAADTDWTLFESGSIFTSLPAIARRVNVYYQPQDAVLWASQQQHQIKRLGRDGPSNIDEIIESSPYGESLHLIRCVHHSSGQLSDKRERLLRHWYYYAQQQVVNDMRAVLCNHTPSGRIPFSSSTVSFALIN